MPRRAVLAALLLATALAATGSGGEGDPPAGPWTLAPSDFLLFERRLVMDVEGKETLRPRGVVTLHGSDLRDGGLFLPADPRTADLPALLAFRVFASESAAWKFDLVDAVRVHADATFRSEAAADGGTVVRAEWTFASRGKGEQTWVLEDGRGTAATTFDGKGTATAARDPRSRSGPDTHP